MTIAPNIMDLGVRSSKYASVMPHFEDTGSIQISDAIKGNPGAAVELLKLLINAI